VSNAQWADVRDLFESLVDEEPAVVRERLAGLRRTAPGMVAEVESLLDHHGRVGGFLDGSPALSVADDELAPGTLLGVYRIEREIGSGGMGRVYLATDTRLDRSVCVKMVRGDLAGRPGLRERLRSEARLAASISHQGICSVHVLEEIDNTLFLVTEFVDGETLREQLARGPFSVDALVAAARELADALSAAHRKGITHRDLKPENVMRTTEGRLKILDFGLARAERTGNTPPPVTMPGAIVGTIAYMAPEQIEGRLADPRTDLFALGVVLYECAAGRHPFSAPTALATSARILGTDPIPIEHVRSDLPAPLAAAIMRCLAKSPDQRFSSAADLLAAIEGPTTAAAPTLRNARWWRIHQLVVIGLYIVAATTAWHIKEWDATAATRWAFLAIGVLVAVAGIARAHLVFTEQANRRGLTTERVRTRIVVLAADLIAAVLLFLDALAIADGRPVAAVLIMALAVGIAVAALLIEPATSAATFDS
jgi:hypothetical protein